MAINDSASLGLDASGIPLQQCCSSRGIHSTRLGLTRGSGPFYDRASPHLLVGVEKPDSRVAEICLVHISCNIPSPHSATMRLGPKACLAATIGQVSGRFASGGSLFAEHLKMHIVKSRAKALWLDGFGITGGGEGCTTMLSGRLPKVSSAGMARSTRHGGSRQLLLGRYDTKEATCHLIGRRSSGRGDGPGGGGSAVDFYLRVLKRSSTA
jgi:hypothetical protein